MIRFLKLYCAVALFFPSPALAEDTARIAQSLLNQLGYSVTVDGVWGPNSQRALELFYSQNNQVFDGTFDETELADLRAAINALQSSRIDFGDFEYNDMESGPRLAFFPKSRNQEASYELIFEDPFSNAGNAPVHQFTIAPGVCGNDQDRGDCGDDPSNRGNKSLRSELSENNYRGTRFGRIQPEQASYEWEIGFPSGFPVGPRQTSGYYTFGQWHNGECPHMNIGNWVNNDDYQIHLRISEIIPGHRLG